MTPHVSEKAALTEAKLRPPETSTGVSLLIVVPSPQLAAEVLTPAVHVSHRRHPACVAASGADRRKADPAGDEHRRGAASRAAVPELAEIVKPPAVGVSRDGETTRVDAPGAHRSEVGGRC